MALPSSGAISLSQVNTELGAAATATRSLNDSAVRTLFGVASGAISMSNGYGKANRASASYTFASNTTNASINVASLSGYSAAGTDVTITVNSGVYVYATSNGNAGLTISGGTASDTVTLINNGYILGQGGMGGYQYVNSAGTIQVQTPATVGGPALSLGRSIRLTNNSYIAGGGGGGAGYLCAGGGGAGGGQGGLGRSDYLNANPSNTSVYGGTGGTGGGPGAAGTPGSGYINYETGGGGGRILPGVGGANAINAGNGGSAGNAGSNGATSVPGNVPYQGAGGGAGGSGGAYNNGRGTASGGGGGGWGAAGGNYYPTTTTLGAAGGKAINLNGNSVTYVTTGTLYGAVS